jgi:hypothetical protein
VDIPWKIRWGEKMKAPFIGQEGAFFAWKIEKPIRRK